MMLAAQNSSSSSEPNHTTTYAQSRDSTALETLFEQYNARICMYLARMVGNDEVGRELAQETFLKAWEAIPHLRNASYSTSWLYRIATNVAIDYLRRKRLVEWLPWERYTETERTAKASIAGPEQHTEDSALLKLALKQVSLSYRACVILKIVEDLPHRQIAERLGIKESSVSKYVSRGLQELRQAYFHLINEQTL